MSVTAGSAARKSTNSEMPPSWWKTSSCGPDLPGRAGQPAFVPDRELQPGDQEGGLAGAGGQLIVGELGVRGEDLPVRPVADPGAGDAALGLADDVEHGAVDERLEHGRRVRLACPGP